MADRTVWKFVIPVNAMTASFTSIFHVPRGARLLVMGEQYDTIALWFEVDPDAPTEKRSFQLFGTGTGPIRDGLDYVGTAIFAGGKLVLHVYEVGGRDEDL